MAYIASIAYGLYGTCLAYVTYLADIWPMWRGLCGPHGLYGSCGLYFSLMVIHFAGLGFYKSAHDIDFQGSSLILLVLACITHVAYMALIFADFH